MRNLKKLLAVILSVAMIASLMVPALAANTYEAEALKLQAINVFAGGPEDLKLDEGVTRIQGLTFAIRIAGKDAEALALTDAEVAEILADWTDADKIPEWGKKYAAYAIKNGITVGLSATQKIFGAMESITGTSFLVFIMKSGMGYADVTTANVLDAAVNAGIVTASQAVAFAEKALIRDDAAAIMYGAFTTGVNADGTKLIDAYIASGATTKEAAQQAGFVVTPPPVTEKLKVESVTALNLKQVAIVFNKPVDKSSAETIANYTIKDNGGNALTNNAGIPNTDAAVAALQEDGRTVIVTVEVDKHLTNLKNNYVQVNAAVKAAGINETLGTAYINNAVAVNDIVAPQVVNVVVTGPKSLKVIFSEPIARVLNSSDFKIDNGSIGLSSIINYDDAGNAVLISTGANIPAGAHKLTVNANSRAEFADYARIPVVKTDIDFTVESVTGAPSVMINSITPQKVVLKFDRAVKNVTLANIYHNYASNTPYSITAKGGIDGAYADTWEIVFAEGKYIPAGLQSIYIKNNTVASNKIEDKWGNKFEDTVLTAVVEADTTPPTVVSVEVVNRRQLKIYFSEEMNKADAENRSYYTFKKSSGAVLKTSDFSNMTSYGNPVGTVGMSFDKNTYILTMTFTSDFPVGDYILTMKDIKDAAGYTENKLAEVDMPFSITNSNNPKLSRAIYKDAEGKIYLTFDKDMATSGVGSVLDTTNYQIDKNNDKNVEGLPSGTTIVMGNTGKEVVITLGDKTGISAGKTFIYATVSAADGKPISATGNSKQLVADTSSAVEVGDIRKIKLVDKTTLTFEVTQPLSSINVKDDSGNNLIKLAVSTSDSIVVTSASYVNQSLDDGIYGAVVTLYVSGADNANKLATGLVDNKLNSIAGITGVTKNIVISANALTNELGAKNGLIEIAYNQDGPTGDADRYKIADNAAPFIVSAITNDVSGNGIIDQMTVVFSEDLYIPSVQDTDFQVENYTVKSVSVSKNIVTLALDEKGDVDSGATPNVRIISDIQDNSSNRNAVSSSDYLAAADGAKPVVKEKIESNKIAKNSTVYIKFSEVLNAASKTDVENAITSGATGGNLAYSWSANVLTITNRSDAADATFSADVTVIITDANGNPSAAAVTLIDIAP